MSDRDRFFIPGSPLQGRPVPYGWGSMDRNAKASCLVAYGWASSFSKGLSMLGRHAAAVRAHRRDIAEAMGRRGGKFSPDDPEH